MRIRRSLPILLAVVALAAVLTLVVQLRKHAPPEAARLLPSADAFVYVNLQWMRRASLAGQLPPVSHDPDYEQFIQATGFQFERDLDETAFAVHYPAAKRGAKSPAPEEARFSEVFVGRIQGERLSAYLRKISTSVDSYRAVDIYNIPLEGRTLRVAILGVDTVAASNHGDPQVIRGIIDRSRKLASPFGGPAFLRQYYKEVPFASLAWSIFRVQPSAEQPSPGPMDLSLLFPKPAVVVASLRYLGAVHLRAEAYTGSEADAQHLAEQVNTFLSIFHAAEASVSENGGPDPDVKQFLDSLKVNASQDRAVLSAIVPQGLIRKALAESPSQLAPQTSPPPSPPPASTETGGKRRHK
ncbi:MAG: hypothetical protein LAN83_19125 [Acidobacteriia bacterium]|nr:hypothetical protein [Terriglobia bacterium]